MPEELRIWEMNTSGSLTEVKRSKLDFEARIVTWIAADISLLSPGLLIIGEQVETASGNFIDLLCIDESGNLFIVELKRGKTPREVTAQALDYASWVKDLGIEEIDRIATAYLNGKSLRDAFLSKFATELPDVVNEHHAMRIVASDIDASTERIIRYLAETYGVDINFVRFQFFRAEDGRQFLARTFTIPPELVERGAGAPHSKRTAHITREKLLGASDENGKAVFEKLLDFAGSHEPKLPIGWGKSGFSINFDFDGSLVAICYCFPPQSVFKQSVYTNRSGIKTKTQVPEHEISRLWSLAQETGLFQTAVNELKCLINHQFTSEQIEKIISWCKEAAATIAKYGPKD